ncbi:hypothetical protein GCM10010912_10460 [Paenibacillus albidus]|uniref:Helix-turn-helix domain-containing protein n=1 Tax=Paenibacillus albidus TaxID=2041023 RepID=A0A917C2V1_9BACL|nr:ABC transporter substrate-binding protein [Paenibacillus albidus]GGF67398.1 hypothetical protein GCM10010912_10460 [Paenibacillus albidus]
MWNQSPVQLIDIRHHVLKTGDSFHAYTFPANGFLFVHQGAAKVNLDSAEYLSTEFNVMHNIKGAVLHISGINQPVDYYLLLYKPLVGQSRLSRDVQADLVGPQSYVFQAQYPLSLLSLLVQMIDLWTTGEELDRLQVSGLFIQWVHEQFRQLSLVEDEHLEPDLAQRIAQYIHEHLHRTISMETMAEIFHYSTHHLARVFKRKYGYSPIEYAIQTRIARAKTLLSESDVSIREVAESVGYKDLYYFSRIFKRVTGETPAQFKLHSPRSKSSIRPKEMPESFIAPRCGQRYIDNNDNHYQYDTWSVNEVNVRLKSSFAVTLLFSLSLLLAACGGAGTDEPAVETRMYKDAMGRQVEIPVNPSRTVVLTYGGYLLPLDLKPVGVNQETLDQYPQDMADVESIGKGTGNKEAILALLPDLIILPDYLSEDIIVSYEKIAPTVAVAWGGDPDVIDTLRTVGDIMNRKQEAEAWIAKFEGKLQGVRDQVNIQLEPGTTAISFVLSSGEVLLGGEGGTLGKLIYQDFGFKMPEEFKAFADGGTVLSMEKLVDQPADYFFTQMDEDEFKQMTELFKEPVYQTIPAVKNNRIINVSREKWNYGPYTVEQGVDALIQQVSQLQQ